MATRPIAQAPEGYKPMGLEDDDKDKFWVKVKKQPFVPLGIVGALTTLAFGAYRFRHKGNQSTSVFLMHLRVQAQSVVVGGMTAGILYSMVQKYVVHNGDDKGKVDEGKQ